MTSFKQPPQKKRFTAKNTAWRKENLDAFDKGITYYSNDSVRSSITEKYINSDLYDGKLNMADMMSTISSAGVLNAYIPKKIQHRPIMRPKIELLLGEATKEPFSWSVMVTDSASISSKQEEKKKLINDKITKLLKDKSLNEEDLAKKLKDLDLYFKYTWKDAKEVRATKILKYFEQKTKLEGKFHECMLDKLVLGEEMLMFDIVGNTVEAIKLDPKKVYTLNAGDSNDIADSSAIVIEEYWSVGKILDHFYDELKSGEIDDLNDGVNSLGEEDSYRSDTVINLGADGQLLDTLALASTNHLGEHASGMYINDSGDYRVLRVLWASQKLVKVVTGVDSQTGEEYEKTMSEEYTPNPYKGETVKNVWVKEWWQGAKIGSALYKGIKPRPAQFNSVGNISKGHPGIVGKFNSISGGKTVSFLSKMKPFQYLYDIVWDRLLDAIKKDLGNIVEMDMAKKPAGWKTEKWLHYVYKGGIMFVDSFKEAVKGSATGKLAGHFNTTGKTISTSNGNYIQQHVNLLEYIKKEMGDIVGVTPQREGAVAASATVGTTERSVMASNNNTAYEFYMHEQFKLESLQILLETAKVALKGNKELMQIILDDFSIAMFEVEGDDFVDSDYAVFTTTSKKSKDVQASLERYSQAFMQNGGGFSTVLDILFSDSVAEKRRKIEIAEADMKQEGQEAANNANKAEQAKVEAEQNDKKEERALKKYEIDTEAATKIQIETMKQNGEVGKLAQNSVEKAEDIQVQREKMASDESIARENRKQKPVPAK